MNNATNTSTQANAAMSHAAFSPAATDGAAASNSNGLGIKFDVPRYVDAMINTIEDLSDKAANWEAGAYESANDQLYQILSRCLQIWAELRRAGGLSRALAEALNRIARSRNIAFQKSNSTQQKIIRIVFGDRTSPQRRSSYAKVLTAADQNGIPYTDLPEFIRKAGGIEAIRLINSKKDTTQSEKAKIAESALKQATEMGVLKRSELSNLDDKNALGEYCVMIASKNSDGNFAIKAIMTSDAAIKAAQAAYFSEFRINVDRPMVSPPPVNIAALSNELIAAVTSN